MLPSRITLADSDFIHHWGPNPSLKKKNRKNLQLTTEGKSIQFGINQEARKFYGAIQKAFQVPASRV